MIDEKGSVHGIWILNAIGSIIYLWNLGILLTASNITQRQNYIRHIFLIEKAPAPNGSNGSAWLHLRPCEALESCLPSLFGGSDLWSQKFKEKQIHTLRAIALTKVISDKKGISQTESEKKVKVWGSRVLVSGFVWASLGECADAVCVRLEGSEMWFVRSAHKWRNRLFFFLLLFQARSLLLEV